MVKQTIQLNKVTLYSLSGHAKMYTQQWIYKLPSSVSHDQYESICA